MIISGSRDSNITNAFTCFYVDGTVMFFPVSHDLKSEKSIHNYRFLSVLDVVNIECMSGAHRVLR